ncbi:hypothetical protein A2774_03780 [Candidatus Roizmanbacteria bacterium RIFCSPHIGHO2_01_FULL_39_12c]|uniref:cysteine desulfurase n=1 Tax=Candidatus Roizmanbacteria bacterium RIFCSPHIGHO2_01_FULL_39_12c TaxID=1802031 RepID=A0A1F7GEJ5_9BACT|nr:MAG: hypothetical protein A2774_03780 [Candidatus Roizmanbacteria bacterium RIFCSPHIGHO2_01_FULL_39_12c]
MDIKLIKKDFPIFNNDPDLVYLDSTATSLKPRPVIEKEREYYEKYSANVFRGIYKISEKATEEYEETRKIVQVFISAGSSNEIVFTRNTTESLNLVAYSLGRKIISQGDELVTTIMEHHSNFVPWQQLTLENGAILKVMDVSDEGYLDLENRHSGRRNATGAVVDRDSGHRIARASGGNQSGMTLNNLDKIITKKTKILALTYVSNVLGTINPIKAIIKAAKKINPEVIAVIDAAQAAPHMKIDVQDLGCDFLAFSSHKMLGPTGVGVLWGRYELLADMFPFNFGGEMIEEVYLDRTVFKYPPHKFEAGTPHIAGVIALKTAVEYLQNIGMEKISQHEAQITQHALNELNRHFSGQINILGPNLAAQKGGIIAFTFGKYHSHDIAQILDEVNICVRAGNHCTMPLHDRLGVNSSVRASFYLYNTIEDVAKLITGLKKAQTILG